MTFDIKPQDFHVLTDRYVIRTRTPVTEITDEMIAKRVRNPGLQVGDSVTVQCMSQDHDAGNGTGDLLHEAEYRVTGRADSLQRIEVNDHNINQVNRTDYRIERVGDWWTSSAGAVGKPASIESKGFGNFAVLDADGNELCVVTKDMGGKALAEDILAGKAPVVQAEAA